MTRNTGKIADITRLTITAPVCQTNSFRLGHSCDTNNGQLFNIIYNRT